MNHSDDERLRLGRLKTNLERRALIFQITRAFFCERGFLEVETPVRAPHVAPEQHIEPFESEGWFLSTSPELHMKRLLAAGYERLFQISRCFRKGEQGRWHNPEFTMLEWYRTGADYEQIIGDTEQLVTTLAAGLGAGSTVQYGKQRVDLSLPWPRITVQDAFLGAAGWDPVAEPDAMCFDIDLVSRVVPTLNPSRPAVLKDYPATMASLARLRHGKPAVAERAEVFIAGLELANAYSELTERVDQESRFRKEAEQIEQEQRRSAGMPWRFLEAMAHLPACGGIALGMDRLVMLFCDADTIADVLPFTAGTA